MDFELKRGSLAACDASFSFLQSGFWAGFKAEFGWKPCPLVIEQDGRESRPLLLMERRLSGGLSFAYAPHGPEAGNFQGLAQDDADHARSAFLAALAEEGKPSLPHGCLFIRFDPPWYRVEAPRSEEEGGDGSSLAAPMPVRPVYYPPLRRSGADVQPPDTVLLDIGKDENLILQGMKAKWRYNIRLAEKKGVVVEERAVTGDWRPALEGFYRLYRETAARDRIALHPEIYYRRLFECGEAYGPGSEKRPDLRIFTARHEGLDLASIVTVFWGGHATYLYGASSNEKRNLMPAYALQWAAIKAARAAGCLEYDLFGIPPRDDPRHPMAGLYRFKTGFGGSIVHRAGSWDYALRPSGYAAFRKAEALRTWYYKDFRKRGH